jgi:hypothetical protein
MADLMGHELNPAAARAYLGAEAFWERLVDGVADSGAEYAAVVVDEAQDLWEPAFAYLSSIVASNGTFAVFVDPQQTTRRERAGLTWEQPRSTLGGQTLRLDCNFRNGDQIIDAVEKRFRIEYQRPNRGAPPGELLLLSYSNSDPLSEVVARRHAELRRADLDPVVLVSGIDGDDLAKLSAKGIVAIPVESFKGLERRAVILALGRSTSPIDPNDEDLYVGMTRATVLLAVVYHASQHPFDS